MDNFQAAYVGLTPEEYDNIITRGYSSFDDYDYEEDDYDEYEEGE